MDIHKTIAKVGETEYVYCQNKNDAKRGFIDAYCHKECDIVTIATVDVRRGTIRYVNHNLYLTTPETRQQLQEFARGLVVAQPDRLLKRLLKDIIWQQEKIL